MCRLLPLFVNQWIIYMLEQIHLQSQKESLIYADFHVIEVFT